MKTLQTGTFFILLSALMLTGFQTAHAQTQISDWNDLNNVRQNLSGSYILMNDLDEETAGYSTFNTGEGWMPIGSESAAFTGTFDGNGHTISGLTIDRDTGDNGLFGFVRDATVKNVGVINANLRVTGSFNGVLFGRVFDSEVENTHASGVLVQDSQSFWHHGGLIGRMHGGTLTKSWASVQVNTLGRLVGGLIGTITSTDKGSAILNETFSTGNVTCRSSEGDQALYRWVGGLVGQFGGSSIINDSYATGSVVGNTQVGGLVGYHWRGSVINRSYSTGMVSGTDEVGGLVGHRDPPQGDVRGLVTASYWDTQASGTNQGVGFGETEGVNGRTTADMKTQATFAGWDFSLVWAMDDRVNNGYPSFLYQIPPAEPVFARAQIIHNAADPAAEVVDIYVNGDLFVEELAFREATPYVDVPADTPLLIEIYGHGSNPSETDAAFTLDGTEFAEDGTYVVIANGVIADGFAANPDEVETAFNLFVLPGRESHDNSGQAAFYIWHGSTDAPAVDVFARDAAQLANGLAYTNATDYIAVSAAEYIIDLTPAGVSDVVASFIAPLEGAGGAALGVLASGFFDPASNNDGPAFGLLAVFADGTTMMLEAREPTSSEPFAELPDQFRLEQNYPNPFNPLTQIEFTLPSAVYVTLEVFNLQGQRVATLVDGSRSAGVHVVSFDAANMASGVYLYRIQAGNFSKVNKMMLVK